MPFDVLRSAAAVIAAPWRRGEMATRHALWVGFIALFCPLFLLLYALAVSVYLTTGPNPLMAVQTAIMAATLALFAWRRRVAPEWGFFAVALLLALLGGAGFAALGPIGLNLVASLVALFIAAMFLRGPRLGVLLATIAATFPAGYLAHQARLMPLVADLNAFARSDGAWLLLVGAFLVAGTLIAFLGIKTYRMLAELQRARADLRTILEQSPIGIAIVAEATGQRRFVNRRFLALMGAADEQALLGRPIAASWATKADYDTSGAILARGDDLRDLEARRRRLDGSEWWALHNSCRASFEGEAVRVVFVNDVTRRKSAEAALVEAKEAAERAVREMRAAQAQLVEAQKMAALGRLVAGVAHEMNTPVGNALVAASALRDDARALAAALAAGQLRRSLLEGHAARSTEAADLAIANLERAARLVGAFKQIAADRSAERRARFDLRAAVEAAQALATMRLTGLGGAEAKAALVNAVPPGITMDSYPGPLEQALSNLIANALQHGLDGRKDGRVRIGLAGGDGAGGEGAGGDGARDARTGGNGAAADATGAATGDGTAEAAAGTAAGTASEAASLTLVVEDDGPGIAASFQPRLFEPFFTTRRDKGAAGLGLHVAHNIATGILGGGIRVVSQQGRGTRVMMVVPRVAPGGG
ncbi:MAG: PAS domain S-box protein [Alphaproteobacteria bacterium]|nr:PAS domain S-box protein [Alphaproteobacteria bacterium]